MSSEQKGTQLEVYLKSNQKAYGTNTNATFLLSNNALNKVEAIQIKDMEVINSFYNVTTANNTICISEPGPLLNTVTIAVGWYTSALLATRMKAALDAGSPTPLVYTVTIDSSTGKVTIASPAAIQLIYATTTLSKVLGFVANSAAAVSITGTNMIDLSGIQSVYVNTNLTTTNIDSNGKSCACLCKVQMDKDYGATVNWMNNFSSQSKYIFKSNLNQINIILKDGDGNILDGNGLNWSMTIVCYF